MVHSELTPLKYRWENRPDRAYPHLSSVKAKVCGLSLSIKQTPITKENKNIWKGYISFPNQSSSLPIDNHSIGIDFARSTREEAMRAMESIAEDMARSIRQ